jgi:hypothetical protein
MSIKKNQFWIFTVVALLVILIGIVAIVERRPAKPAILSTPAQEKKLNSRPLITQSLTVKNGQIIDGVSEIKVAVGQRLKLSVKGLGYSEGDNLVIKGYPGAFFELDELDDPTVIYLTFSKAGTYPMTLSNTGEIVGSIVVSQ